VAADSFQFTEQIDNDHFSICDDVARDVKYVTFDIGRYGRSHHTVRLPAPATECEALQVAERYLSEPLTAAYFEAVRMHDDIPRDFRGLSFSELRARWPSQLPLVRGDLLGNNRFLERLVYHRRTGELALLTGS